MVWENTTYKVLQTEDSDMAIHGSNRSLMAGHRCSCGETFETAEALRQHAREEHGAIV